MGKYGTPFPRFLDIFHEIFSQSHFESYINNFPYHHKSSQGSFQIFLGLSDLNCKNLHKHGWPKKKKISLFLFSGHAEFQSSDLVAQFKPICIIWYLLHCRMDGNVTPQGERTSRAPYNFINAKDQDYT